MDRYFGIATRDWAINIASAVKKKYPKRRVSMRGFMQDCLERNEEYREPYLSYLAELQRELPCEALFEPGYAYYFQPCLRTSEITLRPPFETLTSLRDFYAFEEHVKTANANRGRDVPEEWYEFPVFYFSNSSAIYGPDDEIPYPSYSTEMDYELEVACVIGKPGININAEDAEEYIFGYTIFNDWSARDVQRKEMKVGLGPAKGKDFAKSLGPYIITPDELSDRHTGRPSVYDLEMVARVNGVERSRGNWKDLYWSFGQMIERASQDVWLQPGDVIGSGTVGTGCLLELTKGEGPWLQPGDVVELEIERLGVLRNTVGEKRKVK